MGTAMVRWHLRVFGARIDGVVAGRALRRVAGLLAVAVAAGALPAPDPAVGATATAETPFVHTPAPMPGEVTAAGASTVGAMAWSAETLRAVRLTVDGAPVEPLNTGLRDPRWGVPVRGAVALGPGEHVARLEFEDAAGRRATRTWTFHATDRVLARLAGATRFATAVAVSRATFPEPRSAAAAVLARGDEFADALAGAPLAAAVDAPLLLARPDALPAEVADELRRALVAGATVHLLGGEAALSEAVADGVEALGFRPLRHAGRDRFATAATVAAVLPPSAQAIVASGVAFPDALAASAPAARDGLPILLTARDDLPPATAAALADRNVEVATIVGGQAAVGADVERRVREHARTVRRVAGRDRYATAAAVVDTFYERPQAVSFASGEAFPDALTGTRHATAGDRPLLLTHPRLLSPATAEAIRSHRPGDLVFYGGSAAVAEHVTAGALRAAVDGPDAARVMATTPVALDTVPYLPAVTVTLDRPVDPASSSLYLSVGGIEVPGAVEENAPSTVLTFRLAEGEPARPLDVPHAGRLLVAASDGGRAIVHDDVAFTYLSPDPVFATAGDVALHLPSRYVEMIAFHESAHDGARQLTARDTATPKITMSSRHRGNGSRTSADVVAAPHLPVLAPVTGRVVRAGSYVLYCRHHDDYAVIEPDARPGWEVKTLHFHGLRVRPGDRVVAGRTVIGDGPRPLPFASQVDDHSSDRDWPHVHVEVVDPSIPDRPGRGC